MQRQSFQVSGESLGIKVQGWFRLRLADTRLLGELKAAYPEWSREQLLQAASGFDSGWIKNVVTDFGRRFLITLGWGGATFRMFIAEPTPVAIVRRTGIQFTYASQTPSQLRLPDTSVLDLATLLQTRTVQFPAPSVARNINIVGLALDTLVNSSERSFFGMVAYTKLSSTVVQGTSQTADLQYRVSWSLN